MHLECHSIKFCNLPYRVLSVTAAHSLASMTFDETGVSTSCFDDSRQVMHSLVSTTLHVKGLSTGTAFTNRDPRTPQVLHSQVGVLTIPEKMRLEMLIDPAEWKLKSWMVKIFLMGKSWWGKDLWWQFEIPISIPMTILSLIFLETGCNVFSRGISTGTAFSCHSVGGWWLSRLWG